MFAREDNICGHCNDLSIFHQKIFQKIGVTLREYRFWTQIMSSFRRYSTEIFEETSLSWKTSLVDFWCAADVPWRRFLSFSSDSWFVDTMLISLLIDYCNAFSGITHMDIQINFIENCSLVIWTFNYWSKVHLSIKTISKRNRSTQCILLISGGKPKSRWCWSRKFKTRNLFRQNREKDSCREFKPSMKWNHNDLVFSRLIAMDHNEHAISGPFSPNDFAIDAWYIN